MPLSRPQKADRRNQLIAVQRLKSSVIPDTSGHVDESNPANWETFTKQWANVMPRGSREFFRKEEVSAEVTHQVEMLFNSESKQISQKMRIMLRGRTLNVAEPPRNTDENNHSLIFACIEIKEGS